MKVQTLATARQKREFIDFPYWFYRSDPLWIPPLRSEQNKLFDIRKNAMLQHGDHVLFLATDRGKTVGRAAAFVDEGYNRHWGEKTGFFGSFESIDDSWIASELLQACEVWLQRQGMNRMRGPISFESQNWGVVIDDFCTPSRLMSPYNPPYYAALFERQGLHKVKDLEVFVGRTRDYPMPDRFFRHYRRIAAKYDLALRAIDMKNLLRDVRMIVDLSNRSLRNNWGYAPVSEAEAEGVARDLKMIVRPELVQIVEARGEPIGFCIALPDILQLLTGCNGRLFPKALYRLLFKQQTICVFRIWALGIVPEFQRKGIDTLLYLRLWEALKGIDAVVEANYILEDNYAMRDAVIKLGMTKVRTLRIYEKFLTPG
ncbi:hypothetical protein JW992_14285 [candidate division KSB1 bacterium]|nr:hypothetical protein [candidate division KSB1 bacterium]